MSMQEFWDEQASTGRWASYYDGAQTAKTYNFFTRRASVVRLLAEDGRFGRILDIGCGTGDYAEIAHAHDGMFYGVDFSPQMITQAVDRVSGHGARHLFLVGAGDRLPLADRSVDLVLAMGYIEYFRDPGPPIVEIRRVMKPGATLVMQSFKWELFGNVRRHGLEPLRRRRRGSGGQQGAPSVLPPDFVDRKYSKRELDELLLRFGFRLRHGTYNNFHCLPSGLRSLFPKLYIHASELMAKTPSLWGFFAVNYIGKYVLENPSAEG